MQAVAGRIQRGIFSGKEGTQITWPLWAALVSLTISFEMTETSVVLTV